MGTSRDSLHNVFVYGSFQEPDVLNVLLERTPEMFSATLPGFQRFKLKDRLYPCVIPSETGEVHGKVLLSLSSEELENLDTVEGDQYERVTVGILSEENSEKMPVKTYIWNNKDDEDMDGEWDFEEWKRSHKKNFIETFKEMMKWKKNSEGKGSVDVSHALRQES